MKHINMKWIAGAALAVGLFATAPKKADAQVSVHFGFGQQYVQPYQAYGYRPYGYYERERWERERIERERYYAQQRYIQHEREEQRERYIRHEREEQREHGGYNNGNGYGGYNTYRR